ncbi:MAG: US12 family protein [Clostridia bacterium]|nr:US12 family protein [Clostridia bacterium]
MIQSNAERKRARMQNADFDKLSLRTYNLIIGAVILYGFVVNAIMVATLSDFFMNMDYRVLLIGYIILVIIGSFMTNSKSPLVSFIGYNLVVVPIGALVSVLVPQYDTTSIIAAIVATGAVVFLMIAISTIYPRVFSKMGTALFLMLLLGLVAEVIAMFLGYGGDIFNWLFVLIFSLYIGYDWFRAQSYPRTLDNAVDSALDIYVDAINIFVRLLAIFGNNDD